MCWGQNGEETNSETLNNNLEVDIHKKPRAEDIATHLTSNYPIEHKLSDLFLFIRAYQLPVTPTRQHAIDIIIDIAHSNFSPAYMITCMITKFKYQTADWNNAERQTSNN